MSPVANIKNNEIMREVHDAGWSEGKAEGLVLGKAELLEEMLRDRFGPLPPWATKRLKSATPVQLALWAKKLLAGDPLEVVLGRRRG